MSKFAAGRLPEFEKPGASSHLVRRIGGRVEGLERKRTPPIFSGDAALGAASNELHNRGHARVVGPFADLPLDLTRFDELQPVQFVRQVFQRQQ